MVVDFISKVFLSFSLCLSLALLPGHSDDGREFHFDGDVAALAFPHAVLGHAVIGAAIVFADTRNGQNVAAVLRPTCRQDGVIFTTPRNLFGIFLGPKIKRSEWRSCQQFWQQVRLLLPWEEGIRQHSTPV